MPNAIVRSLQILTNIKVLLFFRVVIHFIQSYAAIFEKMSIRVAISALL